MRRKPHRKIGLAGNEYARIRRGHILQEDIIDKCGKQPKFSGYKNKKL